MGHDQPPAGKWQVRELHGRNSRGEIRANSRSPVLGFRDESHGESTQVTASYSARSTSTTSPTRFWIFTRVLTGISLLPAARATFSTTVSPSVHRTWPTPPLGMATLTCAVFPTRSPVRTWLEACWL